MIYTHIPKGRRHQENHALMVQTTALGYPRAVSSKEETRWVSRQPEGLGREGFHLPQLQEGRLEGFEG